MVGQGYLQGGYCRAGATQFGQEKQGKAGGDHFIVEELLDFSNEEEDDAGMAADEDGGSDEAGGNCSADSCANSFSGRGSDARFSGELICGSLADAGLSGDLCEPYEDLAELEWLSNFVEDSLNSSDELHKQQLISGLKSTSAHPTQGANSPFPAATTEEPSPFTSEAPVPGKARSKRPRTAPCDWSSRLLHLSPTSASWSSEFEAAVFQPSPAKRPAKKKDASPAVLSPAPDGRKCLHCATDKTPQWRAGPMGPKTLCNACGVRFKSGRLVPEYRPAASPTFVLSKHSNSHRKVLELRRQREIQQHQFVPVYNSAVAAAAAVAAEDEFLIQHRLRDDFRQVF